MNKKLKIHWARDIVNNNKWIESVLRETSKDIYLTIDIDVFDPSIMPSTGTPEPGGLGWYQVTEFLRILIDEKKPHRMRPC